MANNVDTRLLTDFASSRFHREKAQRIFGMLQAFREWQILVIGAAHERILASGSAADPEMASLFLELDHTSRVARELMRDVVLPAEGDQT